MTMQYPPIQLCGTEIQHWCDESTGSFLQMNKSEQDQGMKQYMLTYVMGSIFTTPRGGVLV